MCVGNLGCDDPYIHTYMHTYIHTYIHVGVPYAVVWQFEVEYHDIGFSVFLAHDEVEEEVQSWAR